MKTRVASIDVAGLLFAFALLVVLRLSALDNPYYWDEAGAYVHPSVRVAQTSVWSALPGLHERGLLHGHPPVLYLIHGWLFRVFGSSPVPHHLAALFFAAIGVWYTFRVGELLGGRSVGICAALLLLFTPMFFAQAPMVLGDLPVASLGILSAYFLLQRQRLAYAIAATLMIQTKETALATNVALALYWFLVDPRDRRPGATLMHAIPIASLVAFFAIEYVATGTLVQAPYFSGAPLFVFDLSDPLRALASIADQAKRAVVIFFLAEGRYLLSGLVVLGLIFGRPSSKVPLMLLAFVAAPYLGAFSLISFLPRYFLPIMPFFCIATASAVSDLVRARAVWQYAVTAAVVVAFLSRFYVSRGIAGNFETNLQHEKVIAATKRVCAYVEENHAGRQVVAHWPLSLYLSVPELGYVSSPVPGVARDPGEHVGMLVHSSMSVGKTDGLRDRILRQGGRIGLAIYEPEIGLEVVERR